MNINRFIRVCAFASLAALAAPSTVFAVDGVILIDQNKALAGNITPGDAPGFPVTITQPGSYRLDGNLTLPDVNTNGINIQADNVTIDLNGFSIIGPNVCTVRVTFGVSAMSCTPGGNNGTGIGISSENNSHITIRNGKIQGTGFAGVEVFGSALIEGVQVRSTLEFGIAIYSGIVKNCATDTIDYGFSVENGTIVNVVAENHPLDGIGGFHVLVTNSVVQNAGTGLDLSQSSYSGNILRNNGTNVNGHTYSVNTGQNVCDNAFCP